MKYSKEITVYLEKFRPIKIGVMDAPSFEACDEALFVEVKKIGVELSEDVRQSLKWCEDE